MSTSLFIFSVLISLTSLSGGLQCSCAAKEDTSSLQYVYAFFRHGIRTPLHKPYPNDPNKSKYHEYLPGPPGSLTKIGKQIMYDVGKKLKTKYGKFLGEFENEKVHISSTDMSRTIMTALTVMAGLFPPRKPILEDLKWQPVPVWQDSRAFDKAYIYNDENFPKIVMEECPKYGALIEKGYDLITEPDETKGRHKLYKLLQYYTGEADLDSINKHYNIWDTLQFESLNGLPLPPWATEPQPHYDNKPLYPDLMQPLLVEWFRDTEYLKNNKEMLQFYSGPIFNSIHEYMSEKIKKPHSHERMRFHATHDTTLYVMLWALGVRESDAVGPGDGIIFELHNINDTSVVKVLYYDPNHNHEVKELVLPHCSSPCDFQQFVKATPAVTPQQWQQNCQP